MNKTRREKIRKAEATGKIINKGKAADNNREAISQWQKSHRAKQNYYTRKSNCKRFIQRDANINDCQQIIKWTRARINGINNGTVNTNKPWM